MPEQMTYEKAHVTDYGTLQELTAGCLQSTGGDALVPSGKAGELTFGTEAHTSQIQCTSTP